MIEKSIFSLSPSFPPPGGPPLLGNQPSILGNPPPLQYLHMMPQNMGPMPNRPQNPGAYSSHQFESSMPGPVHMGSGMGSSGFSQHSSHLGQPYPPNPQIITTRDQYGAATGGGDQFANTLIHAPPGLMLNQENHGAFSVYHPLGKIESTPSASSTSSWPQYSNIGMSECHVEHLCACPLE